jgi:hypothetical protein
VKSRFKASGAFRAFLSALAELCRFLFWRTARPCSRIGGVHAALSSPPCVSRRGSSGSRTGPSAAGTSSAPQRPEPGGSKCRRPTTCRTTPGRHPAPDMTLRAGWVLPAVALYDLLFSFGLPRAAAPSDQPPPWPPTPSASGFHPPSPDGLRVPYLRHKDRRNGLPVTTAIWPATPPGTRTSANLPGAFSKQSYPVTGHRWRSLVDLAIFG